MVYSLQLAAAAVVAHRPALHALLAKTLLAKLAKVEQNFCFASESMCFRCVQKTGSPHFEDP